MAEAKFTDEEVSHLVNERKQLPRRWERRLLILRPKEKTSHKRSGLVVRGQTGEFEIRVRQCTDYPLDFSVIIAFRKTNENSLFILRRYNGRHPAPHVNKPLNGPKESLPGFHIHMATEEAQRHGRDEEAYAVGTSDYTDVFSAIDLALKDCNFDKPPIEPDKNPDQSDFWRGNG
ncbi:hypothetical protein [Candidatus Binatus soli]|jgi:hypothetical protein|uniref:hypothetical protein n=1 Tax=Candidatus Binatus soli TaxID=1953413 RepID=UPI003D117999